MQFSIETIQKIENLLVAELGQALETEEVKAGELEQALRNGLQEIGRESYGKMLSVLDRQQYEIVSDCECRKQGKRVSQREAQVLSVFGWSSYRRSYYQCECGRHWYALDEDQDLRAGQATEGMSQLLSSWCETQKEPSVTDKNSCFAPISYFEILCEP